MIEPLAFIWVSMALIAGALVTALIELGIARSLVWAGIRTILQLMLAGKCLSWIIHSESEWIAGLVLIVMTGVATFTVAERVFSAKYLSGPKKGTLIQIFLSFVLGAWLFSFFAKEVVFADSVSQKVSVLLPFAGLLIGNSLSGISLGLTEWNRAVVQQMAFIETRLAHGATCWEASHPVFKHSILTSLTPILNAMSVAGIVSLPGMMTGQLIAGVDPLKAVEYQVVAMFLIAMSTLVGTLVALFIGFRKIFNSHHQIVCQGE